MGLEVLDDSHDEDRPEPVAGGAVRFTAETAAEFGRRGGLRSAAKRRAQEAVTELHAALEQAIRQQVDLDDVGTLGRDSLKDLSFSIVSALALRILLGDIKVDKANEAVNVARLFHEIGLRESNEPARLTDTSDPAEIESKVLDMVQRIKSRAEQAREGTKEE